MIEELFVCVPHQRVHNKDNPHFDKAFISRFIETTGIEERRIDKSLSTEDLMLAAAKQVVTPYSSIVTVSQTPKGKMPGIGFQIANKLGLKTSSIFDLNFACDGFPKAMWIASQVASMDNSPVLLLCGDTLGSLMPQDDATVGLIFGDAAAAAIISPKLFVDFQTETFPNGADLLSYKDKPFMNGEAVTQFATKKVPEFMKRLSYNWKMKRFYFHQANRMILNSITRRLNLDEETVPHFYKNFGNCSSASIPLAMVLDNAEPETEVLLCGFGAGLSISSIVCETPKRKGLIEI